MTSSTGPTAWRRIRALIAGAIGIILVLAAYAFAIEPRRLRTTAYRLGVPGLAPPLEGVTIAHLTDFHVGMAGTRRSTLRRAVALAIAAHPDLIALTGDFVHNGRWLPQAGLFNELADSAPTFAVLGNHDHAASPTATERVVAELRSQGAMVLRNEHAIVPLRGGAASIVVVAVDDPSQDRDNLSAAMVGLPASPDPDRPTILLGHAPDIVDRAPAGRFALTLAGHTHGGQIRSSPFKRRTPLDVSMVAGGLDSAYARGALVVNGNPLFVNAGLGVSGVPFRFLAPPQIVVFTLTGQIDQSKAADDPARHFQPESN